MVDVANIVVGEADVFIGEAGTAFASCGNVGATIDGVEISWEPDMVDIEIDQFGDAAKVIQSRVKVMLKTTLAEATVVNLAHAWNYSSTVAATDSTAADIVTDLDTVAGASASRTFKFGIENVYPYEKVLRVVGTAPGSTAAVTKTREFQAKRAVSFSSSSHSMKRTEPVAFPVEFRILPSRLDVGYEYGKIIDQVTLS
mgnify:CR=1 FL=1|jgi:hypothetical protein|tara:strand:+ start:1547 stop:2143 length:597 start_codon:yes stop_codon:yes gene_type:complete